MEQQYPVRSKRLFYLSKVSSLMIGAGTSQMKVDDIASSLGVTKKTLYNYFESKQQMVDMVVDYYFNLKINEFRSKLSSARDPLSLLLQIAYGVIPVFSESSSIIVDRFGYSNQEELIALVESKLELFEITEYAFRKGIADGLIVVDVDSELQAIAFISSLEKLAFRYQHNVDKQLLNRLIYGLLRGSCTFKGVEFVRNILNIEVAATM